MQNATLNKIQWVELFHSAGLDEAMMQQWHQLFEQRYPEQQQVFLEWLQIPEAHQDFLDPLGVELEEIQTIRQMYKQ